MNSKLDSYFRVLTILIPLLIFSACSHRIPRDSRSSGASFEGTSDTGYASWYGPDFNGKKTASGEIYDMYAMTAAHRKAPFGTSVRVINLDNGRQTTVTINDRGPFVRGRIIDLSKKAAEEIGMTAAGTAKVRLEFLDRKPLPNAYPSANAGTTYIQIGSFESESNAQYYVDQIRRLGPGVTVRIYKENNLFRIRSGPYSSVDTAQPDLDSLKKTGFNGFILHSN